MAINRGTNHYYINPDHLNAPHSVGYGNGQNMWLWQHGPFGEDAPNNNPNGFGAFTFNLRFPGQYYDSETGLAYNGFRDINLKTGQYAESDPLGLAGAGIGAVNLYGYVYNNPLTWIDPDGLDPQKGGRGDTGGSSGKQTDSPYKHCKLDPCDPNFIICKDNHTGKTVRKPKPPDWEQYKFSPLPEEPSPSVPVPVPAPAPSSPWQIPQWMQPKPWWIFLPIPGNPLYEGL